MSKVFGLLAILIISLTTGCAINHPVAKDYDQHLIKYGAEMTLPRAELEAGYQINSKTENHRYEFRAATVGYAHVWIVELGKILDKTLNAEYVQSAFGKLEKGAGQGDDSVINFELENFEFKNYRAYTTLNIKLKEANREIFNKSYRSEGDSQGGQMWGAGPFGMKNATLKSTKNSIDKILTEFINDLNQIKR